MISFQKMGLIGIGLGGAYVGGRMANRRAQNNPEMGQSDRLGATVSIGAFSGVAAAGAAYLGYGAYKMRGPLGSGLKLATYNPIRSAGKSAAKAVEKGTASWAERAMVSSGLGQGRAAFKGHGKGMGLILGLATIIGATAYSYRKNPDTAAYAERDQVGGMTTVRDRMDRMGASGDMVFGLNNNRHG